MKDAVIAKLANQAADFYGDAFKQCQYKDSLPKVGEGRARVEINLQRRGWAVKQHSGSHVVTAVKIPYRLRVLSVWMVCALSVWFFFLLCVFFW